MSTTTTISVENASTGLDVGGGHESSSAPDQDRLKSYSRIKLALAGQLRVLRDIVKKHGNERRERQCAELQVKLAEDRFTLAVVGQFKRGKSSLLNAIIGRELLPTGVLPLTSAITVLKFGPRERLVIEREGSPFLDTVPLDRLADYVTERGNPSNRLRVKTASVEVPLPFLRRGLEFVDTPGVGSTITANTATTDAFLPACDAVLLVTSVESPFTSVETEFLQAIRESVHKIFFVVNKTDLLAGHECREVLEFVTQTIREQTDTPDVRLFPVSCRLGLAAKREHDDLAYARSGLKILEEALAQFLSDEKTATFLAAVVDQALRILEAQAAEMHTRGSSAVQGQPANDVLPMPDLDDVRQRIISLRDEIRGLPTAAPIAEAVPQPMVESLPAPLEVVPAETDLTRDLRTRGCPVCDHLRKWPTTSFGTNSTRSHPTIRLRNSSPPNSASVRCTSGKWKRCRHRSARRSATRGSLNSSRGGCPRVPARSCPPSPSARCSAIRATAASAECSVMRSSITCNGWPSSSVNPTAAKHTLVPKARACVISRCCVLRWTTRRRDSC
jgi:predicted GTPase